MRALLSVVLFVHGVAHTVGFVVPWRLITSPEMPYRTSILKGTIDVGAMGVRLLGIGWLVVALAFVALAASVWQHGVSSYRDAFVLVGMSLALCALDWPEAGPGLIANAVILALLVIGGPFGWFV